MEVDLEYSDELHELSNDYPLGPEKLKISHDILSNYCRNVANKYSMKASSINKLVLNLGNKNKCFSLQKSSVVFVIRNKIGYS